VVRNRESWQWTGEGEDVTAERKRDVSRGAQAFWTGGEDGFQDSAGLLPWYSQKDVYDGLLRGGSPSVSSGEWLYEVQCMIYLVLGLRSMVALQSLF
jgi:hypothetical protein